MKLLRNLSNYVLTMEKPLGYNAFAQRRRLAVYTDAEASNDNINACGQGGRNGWFMPPKINGR